MLFVTADLNLISSQGTKRIGEPILRQTAASIAGIIAEPAIANVHFHPEIINERPYHAMTANHLGLDLDRQRWATLLSWSETPGNSRRTSRRTQLESRS